jgi:chorismate mutase/prephenate dehydratase
VSRHSPLETLRAQIDHLDDQLVRLLNRRAELAVKVGEAKARSGHGTAKYAPEREKRIFQRLTRMNGGPLRPQHLRTIFREVISSCLALEQPLRIAYLGPAGTYSQQAAAEQFGSGPNLLPLASVDAVFDEVERGRAEYGVVPVENSTEGVVAQTLDRFISSPLTIKAEVLLRIDHCLLAKHADPRRVRRIVSHPQSLAQCRSWLSQHFNGVPVEEVASNAAAAALAARQAGTAAIAGRRAAERYKLKVVAGSIQDQPNNVTRFLVISYDLHGKPTGDDKTSILFAVPHEAGALFRVLEAFARQRINLSTIESRPLKGRAWEYVFFIDLAGHTDEARMVKALAGLKRRALFVKVLGSYPAWRWPEGEVRP